MGGQGTLRALEPAWTMHSAPPGRHPPGSAGPRAGSADARRHTAAGIRVRQGSALGGDRSGARSFEIEGSFSAMGRGASTMLRNRRIAGAERPRARSARPARRTAPQVPPPHPDHRPTRCRAHARIDCRGQSLDLTGIIPGSRYPASSCGRASPRTATTGGCDRRTVLCPATTASTHGACSPR